MGKVKQLFDIGEEVKINGNVFEVWTVSVRSDADDSAPAGFNYEFILKSDADAIREKNERTAILDEQRAQAQAQEAEERKARLLASVEVPTEA